MSTCVDCGYVKTRFKSPPCPVYHSGLHRWSELEQRAPGDRKASAAKPLRCRLGFHKLRVIRELCWFDYCECLRCGQEGYRLA